MQDISSQSNNPSTPSLPQKQLKFKTEKLEPHFLAMGSMSLPVPNLFFMRKQLNLPQKKLSKIRSIQNSFNVFFLLTKNGHVVPIIDLEPEVLKTFAKEKIVNPIEKEIKHTQILNHVVSILGSTEGFQGYRSSFYPQMIKPFLDKNGLAYKDNLIHPRYGLESPRLYYQQLSEYLFSSAKLPEKLFTGFDFDWSSFFELLNENKNLKTIGEIFHNFAMGSFEKKWLSLNCFSLESGSRFQPFEIGTWDPKITFENIVSKDIQTQEKERIKQSFLLLQQQFLNVSEEDWKKKFSFRQQYQNENPQNGWVEVIPFPSSSNFTIIFLKTKDGRYDFIFRNQRDQNPPTQHRYLALQDYPTWYEPKVYSYRKKYFQLENSISNKSEKKKKYLVIKESGDTPTQIDISKLGFKNVELKKKKIYISDLISIKNFNSFLNESDYLERRDSRLSSLNGVNNDPENLPACITWYDAVAFLSYCEEKTKLPLRLLTREEYISIYDISIQKEKNPESYIPLKDLLFFDSEDLPFNINSRYLSDEELSHISIKFNKNLNWKKNSLGLQFLLSYHFAEWVYDEKEFALGINQYLYLKRELYFKDLIPPHDCGKRQNYKVGFRICYSA